MNTPFYYLLKIRLIRSIKSGKPDFFEYEEKFENTNPIAARKRAFEVYQNYIDVLLESKGFSYRSDKQTRKDLFSFLSTKENIELDIDGEIINFNEGLGIGVFFIINNRIKDDHPIIEALIDKCNDVVSFNEFIIHGIGNINYKIIDPDSIVFNLTEEYKYYKHYNYNTKAVEKEIKFCSRDDCDTEPELYTILSTPFEWSDYSVPDWWENTDEINFIENQSTFPFPNDLKEIIENGETKTVEFKPSLMYNFKTDKYSNGIKQIIARSICSFLNSKKGGILLIGINNNKEVQGLSFDFSLSNKKDEKDYFLLEFDKLIKNFFPLSLSEKINGYFYEIEEDFVFLIKISPSLNKPAFMKDLTEENRYYIRREASTEELKNVSEIVEHFIEKWLDRNI